MFARHIRAVQQSYNRKLSLPRIPSRGLLLRSSETELRDVRGRGNSLLLCGNFPDVNQELGSNHNKQRFITVRKVLYDCSNRPWYLNPPVTNIGSGAGFTIEPAGSGP